MKPKTEETEPPTTNHIATAEAFDNLHGHLNQIRAHIISTHTRSDELDRREKLLEAKESRFRFKEAELKAIEERITEKLLDLESIENLISEKRKECDLVRKRVGIRVRDLEEAEAKARKVTEDWSRKVESKEREPVEKLRSNEESMEVSVSELYRIAKDVEECTNEAKKKETEVESAKMRVREVERRERWVELESRRVEDLRSNVELKEKDLCAMEKRLKEYKERDWGLFVKAAEECKKTLKDRERALNVATEEINRKKRELQQQDEDLKSKRSRLVVQQFGNSPRANNADSSSSDVASSYQLSSRRGFFERHTVANGHAVPIRVNKILESITLLQLRSGILKVSLLGREVEQKRLFRSRRSQKTHLWVQTSDRFGDRTIDAKEVLEGPEFCNEGKK